VTQIVAEVGRLHFDPQALRREFDHLLHQRITSGPDGWLRPRNMAAVRSVRERRIG